MALKQRIAAVVARVTRLKPVRVVLHFTAERGPLLSAGLSFQAIFAVFAAIWVGFAIAGFAIQANAGLRDAILDLLSTNIPGLLDDGTGIGIIGRDALFETGILGWTGAIAAVGLFFTALGWLDSGRAAVRAMFELEPPPTNFLLLKLRDLGLVVALGAAIVLSAVLSVLSTTALSSVFDWLGVDDESLVAIIGARAIGLVVVLLLDVVVLALFYRVVSSIRIPFRLLAQGTLIAGVALGVLKALGNTLLGGATNNPLLASFAVIIGLLIWFHLICQVILLGAAWIAVTAADADVDLTGHKRAAGRKAGTSRKATVGTAL